MKYFSFSYFYFGNCKKILLETILLSKVVIPVKTGIQSFHNITSNLDSRLRGNDDIN